MTLSLSIQHDPVLRILDDPNVSEKDIYLACETFSDVSVDDVIYSYHIWISLQDYLHECESGVFVLLDDYDFDMENPDRPDDDIDEFHLDLAIKVANRAHDLLDEIYSWDIMRLKRKVNRLMNRIVSSDAVSLLTMLVLRIVSKFSRLEFQLHLAVSKSTLIKINYELTGLLRNIGKTFDAEQQKKSNKFLSMFGSSTNMKTSNPQENPLLIKYRSFVRQLIQEIESTPFESVQQEMFQVVHDLRQMFVQFSKSAEEAEPEPNASPSAKKTKPQGEEPELHYSSGSSSANEKTSIAQELPFMIQAFEHARQLQDKQEKKEDGIQYKNNPLQHKKDSPFVSPLTALTASNKNKAIAAQKLPIINAYHHPQQMPHTSHQTQSNVIPKTLQVEVVDNRVMVKTPTGLKDMQEWLNMQNAAQVHTQTTTSNTVAIKESTAQTTGSPKASRALPQVDSSPIGKPNQRLKDMSKESQTDKPVDINRPEHRNTIKPENPPWLGFIHNVEKDLESNYADSMGF